MASTIFFVGAMFAFTGAALCGGSLLLLSIGSANLLLAVISQTDDEGE